MILKTLLKLSDLPESVKTHNFIFANIYCDNFSRGREYICKDCGFDISFYYRIDAKPLRIPRSASIIDNCFSWKHIGKYKKTCNQLIMEKACL